MLRKTVITTPYKKKKRKKKKGKQQLKHAAVYLFFNYYSTVGPKLFYQITGIPMRSDPAHFFANLFLYFYESNWMKKLKKNDLIKAKKLCNIFGFIDDLKSINDSGEFASNFSKIHPEELQLLKENTDKHEASFFGFRHQNKRWKVSF